MASSENDAEIIIIGAGLSGLASALLLIEQGRSVRIVEAREKPGGRIRSVFAQGSGSYLADLGPTWVWPAFQPVISRWIDRLEIAVFPQYEAGKAILDYGPDTQPEYRFLPGQEGNARITGGLQALIDRLVAHLPETTILTGTPVLSVSTTAPEALETAGVVLKTGNARCPVLKCGRVIAAVPPRIALNSIDWKPALPAPLTRALDMMPTWMSPHAKAVALYEEPFWRRRGLSGRIASQAGPVTEGHDHCGPEGSPAALFGFIGWPHDTRKVAGSDLETHIRDQLQRCFGPGSPEPFSIHIEDWASDPYVATPRELTEPMPHPDVGPEILRLPHADGKIWFAGSETARRSPGLVEGAFDAAEQTVARIAQCSDPLPVGAP